MREQNDDYSDYSIDVSSLTCCFLFLLAKLEPVTYQVPRDDEDEEEDDDDDERTVEFASTFDRGEMWRKYLEVNREDVFNPAKKGTLPIFYAIRLCHQMNPVITDIWKQDPSVLDSLDAKLELPPFLVAATITHNRHHCKELGEYNWHEYKSNNTVNTTYQLLRANPTMINKFRPPSHDESEENKRKRAASNAAKQKGLKRKRREKNPYRVWF